MMPCPGIVGIAKSGAHLPHSSNLAALQAASNLAVMELKRTIEALPLEKPVAPAIAAKLALLDVNEFNLLLRELAREQQAYRCSHCFLLAGQGQAGISWPHNKTATLRSFPLIRLLNQFHQGALTPNAAENLTGAHSRPILSMPAARGRRHDKGGADICSW